MGKTRYLPIFHHLIERSLDDSYRAVICERVSTFFQDSWKVLDVGCNDGKLAWKLMQQHPGSKVFGVDIQNIHGAKIQKSLYGGKCLPFADQTFDLVMAVDVLHHAESPESVLKEMVRVSRRYLLIKDHIWTGGAVGFFLLAFADWLYNEPNGIPCRYKFMKMAAWNEAFAAQGLEIKAVTDVSSLPLAINRKFNSVFILEKTVNLCNRFHFSKVRQAMEGLIMWKKVSDKMIQFMNGRVVIAAAILLGLFMILAFPQQSARMEAAAKGGGSPDTSFLYTPEDLYRMAETHGADGRQLYVRTAFTFDLAFPLIYTFSLAGMVSWVCGRLLPAGSRLRLANLVPLAGMLLDFLENSCVSLVMLRYPVHTPGVDVLAPLFTLLKWLFTSGSFLMILCGVVFVFVSRLKKR